MKEMPPLIYGTAWKKERTADLVKMALWQGFKGVDTACQPKHYHEAGVGEGLENFKQEGGASQQVYIQTKFTPVNGQDPFNIPYDKSASLNMQVHQSCEASLKNLRVSSIDALLMHSPLSSLRQTMEVWHAMEELVTSGKVRLLGLSNCYDLTFFRAIYEACSIKPKILQNRFYADTNYDLRLRKFCLEKGIVYQGFWTLTANPHLLGHPLVRQLAKEKDVTPAALFFRFLTQINIVPLIGTTSEQHMEEDLAIFAWSLSETEVSRLASLL